MSDPCTPLHLSWNTYSSVYSASFSDLRKKPKFEDVTLVVEDGHVLAHKILLSTCSPLLKNILELSSPNPGVVFLSNVSIKNLNLILDFMYTGEANVVNEDLNEFLGAASTLKVMGLTENKDAEERTGELVEDVEGDEAKKEEVKESTEEEDVKNVLLDEEDTNQTTPKSTGRAKKTTSSKTPQGKTTSAKTPSKTPQGKKRKSLESASSSKKNKKVSDEDSASILGKIRDENEPEECIIEVSPTIPDMADDEVSLNDSDFEAFGVDTDNTIDEITLDDDPIDDQDGKIILTRSKEDQVKLREIFDSFSKSKMKGAKTAWECTKCNRDFTNKRYVDSHIDFKHTDHILHKCLECGMIRKSNDALTRHMGKLHKKK